MGQTRTASTPSRLAFQDVTFSYNGNDAVLSGLSFQLKPGSVLGLLGRTGSGKTTLARLIFRLYDPAAGCIEINGQDIRESRPGNVAAATLPSSRRMCSCSAPASAIT